MKTLCLTVALAVTPALSSAQVSTVEITPASGYATAGTTLKFNAVARDASGRVVPGARFGFFAAPFDVAFAEADGTVRMLRAGQAQVFAVADGKVGMATVTVTPKPPASVRLELEPPTVVVGGVTRAATTVLTDSNEPLTGANLSFQSLDPNIAAVDAAGVVTGRAPGTARIVATAGSARGEVAVRVIANPVARLEVSGPATARTGDVVRFTARALDAQNHAVADAPVRWTVSGVGADVYADGAFVAERAGTYLVNAIVGDRLAAASITIAPRRHARRLERVFARPWKDVQIAEHWAVGDVLYVSTIGDRIYTFDIRNPAAPVLVDSVLVDATVINDISTTADGSIGVLTREGASSRRNGIVFLDLADPLHPKVLSEFTQTVTGGVHSAYVDGRYVYATDDATGSLRIISFADPKNPKEVGRWEVAIKGAPAEGGMAAGRYLHDVHVVDGLAYLAYWRDGLIILDVGKGIRGGSPEKPQFVSQLTYNYNDFYPPDRIAGTHAVFRYRDYVFLGDEVFPAQFDLGSRERIEALGHVHVVDVRDVTRPRKVGEYRMPGGAHNMWVDDDVMYIGAYEGGVRAVDVSGELRGSLTAQGREIDAVWTGHPDGFRPNLPMAWGAQPHKGFVFTTDINSGLWVTRLTPRILP
jgi:hypothetical protein